MPQTAQFHETSPKIKKKKKKVTFRTHQQEEREQM